MSKAKYWADRFSDVGELAVGEFVAETAALAAARGKSDAAAESAVREQRAKLAAAGLDPADLDDWLVLLEPGLAARAKAAAGKLKGYMAVEKFGLRGRRPVPRGKGRRPAKAGR